jgi:type IV pilus assembly protein PilQ
MTSILAFWAIALALLGGPVTGVSIAPDAGRTNVAITVEGAVTVRPFTMEGPPRLVVDLMGARHALPGETYVGINRGGIVSVRSTQLSTDVVRIVLELAQPVPYVVNESAGVVNLSLENRGGVFQPWSTDAASTMTATSVAAQAAAASILAAPVLQVPQVQVVSPNFLNTPLEEVLALFAEVSGRSIIAGAGVIEAVPTITATLVNQPWDQALRSILRTNGLVAEETPEGIIEVHVAADLSAREEGELLITQSYRINYATAQEITTALEGVLTERGTAATVAGANAVVVTDIARVHTAIQGLIQTLDTQPPQVTIEGKIIFVSRTDLDEFGITYDLKDSAGNQLNVVTPGATDSDGDGIIELPDEQVEIGTNVISLGGNSVAALGNATTRVAGPTLTLLTSLLVGRHTLLAFVEALESTSMSEVQAAPLLRVLDNNSARIMVGERTPIRVIDASAGGGGAGGGGAGGGGGGANAGGLPVASVTIEETGIILTTTPHVTDGDMILLELEAERSAPRLAATDAGVSFDEQNANTRVLVRDGQTVVIGGLTVTDITETRAGIPLLMDLPLIGRLFRVTRRANIQRDLIILVTPHIVRSPTD